jgi:hypothetical protein
LNFFQNHRVISTLIALALAAAATALLFILSSTADVVPRTDTSTQTSTAATGQYLDTDNQAAGAGSAVPDSDTLKMIEDALAINAGSGSIESTQYVDIDGDGSMETLVLVRGEGDARPLDWYLLKLSGGEVQKLFERTRVAQGGVRVDGPRIVEREGLYGPGDEACCPSEAIVTYYVWKEGGLVVSTVESSPASASP